MKILAGKRIQSTGKNAATEEEGSMSFFEMGGNQARRKKRGINGGKGNVPLGSDADKIFALYVFMSQAVVRQFSVWLGGKLLNDNSSYCYQLTHPLAIIPNDLSQWITPHSPGHHGPVISFVIIQGSLPCSNKEMTSGLEMESPVYRKRNGA